MDDWDAALSFVMDVRGGARQAWWGQHNEHRLVLTRLLVYPALTASGGRLWLLSVAALASVALGGWLLAAIARQDVEPRHRAEASTPWLAACLGLMWLWSQHETLEWGLNVTFALAMLVPTAALWVQGRGAAAGRPATHAEHAWSAVLGVAAAGTIAAGLLVLPLLALRAWSTRAPNRVVLGYALVGLLTAAAYLTGYVSPVSSGSPLTAVLTAPISFGAFVCLFLGGSVRWLLGGSRAAGVAGGLAGIAYALLWLRAGWELRRRKPEHQAAMGLWCLATYVVLMAAVVAAGRTEVFGSLSALASRYNTLALWGWAALGLLALQLDWVTPQHWGTRHHTAIALLCALVVLRQAASVAHTFAQGPDRSRAGLALALHVDDAGSIQPVYPVPARAIAIARRSELQQLGFLAQAPFAGLRGRLGQAVGVSPLGTCRAELDIDETDDVPGPLRRISGRLFVAAAPAASPAIAVVEDNVVAGFMMTGWPGAASVSDAGVVAELTGYASLSPTSHAVLAWGNQACAATVRRRP